MGIFRRYMNSTSPYRILHRKFLALLLVVQFINLSIEPRSIQALGIFAAECDAEIESLAELFAEVVWDIDPSLVDHDIPDESQAASVDTMNWCLSFCPTVRMQPGPPVMLASFRGDYEGHPLTRKSDVTSPPPEV